MSIFVARGFLSGQPAVTDNRPYLDVGLASQVKNTLADAANEDEALEAICDARFLSAGGLESDLPEHISMSQGDQVLFADDAPELEGVHHQQTVEVVVGANVAYDVREKLAGLIWPDRAIETMWFSSTPVLELAQQPSGTPLPDPSEGMGVYTVESDPVEDVLELAEPNPLESQNDGSVLAQLGGWPVAGNSFSDRRVLICHVDDGPSTVGPLELEFDRTVPGASQLERVSCQAQLIFKNDTHFWATGLLGRSESGQASEETVKTRVLGVEEFDPVELANISEQLSVELPGEFQILSIDAADLKTILRASESGAGGPDYRSPGDAHRDITKRLEEGGQEGWLSEQPADVVIEGWTEALDGLNQDSSVPWASAAKLQQLAKLYDEYRLALKDLAGQVQVGTLGAYSPTETLFTTLFRNLQERGGLETNITAEKLRIIREEGYSVEFPSREESPHASQYIDPPSKIRDADTLARQLQKTKQIILYGPPGTGKTYTARRFAQWWVSQQDAILATADQVRTVTFHPSYAYEDFVEGLTARSGTDGNVVYEIEQGIFRELCAEARAAFQEASSPGEAARYVLIIDEINRGDLSQILGELITGLERDKREGARNAVNIALAHSGSNFSIPPNVYIIGTMNTADRSVALIDDAIRRRFRFISKWPNFQVVLDHYNYDIQVEEISSELSPEMDMETALILLSIAGVEILNERILASADMQKGQQVGHTFLMNLHGIQEIVDCWRFEILPLIEEHYFGQFARIRDELFDGRGALLYDWDVEEIRSFDGPELVRALKQLVESSGRVTDGRGGGGRGR